MPRLTLSLMRQTRLPEVLGRCVTDIPSIAAALNAAEQRLLYAKESGDEGWYGTWAHAVYNVLSTDPYLPLGRNVGRLQRITICRSPVMIQNPFFEFLQYGNGYQPQFTCSGTRNTCQPMEGYDRGWFPTFRDMTPGHLIRVRAIDPLDQQGNKRILIQGLDTYDHQIYSLDGINNVQGTFLVLSSPFSDTQMTLNKITGIQKDITNGQVEVSSVDPLTGDETLILTMEPGEQVANYRRYYLHNVPRNCCPVINDPSGAPTIQVDAIVKLNAIPVRIDPDYLLLQNEEALISECQSMRYSTMDSTESKALAKDAHRVAIGLLQGELAHYLGTDNPAIIFKPFGSATLERQGIGTTL